MRNYLTLGQITLVASTIRYDRDYAVVFDGLYAKTAISQWRYVGPVENEKETVDVIEKVLMTRAEPITIKA